MAIQQPRAFYAQRVSEDDDEYTRIADSQVSFRLPRNWQDLQDEQDEIVVPLETNSKNVVITIQRTPELDYYRKHQDEIVEKYDDKYVVIKGRKVIGAYGSTWEALYETSKTHELGTFFVVGVFADDVECTIHSRERVRYKLPRNWQAKKGSSKLRWELAYYIKHQDEMVKKYDGKYVVIKDHKVLGAYDSTAEAVDETTKTHELGTFQVQRVSEGDADYTATLRWRVSLNRHRN